MIKDTGPSQILTPFMILKAFGFFISLVSLFRSLIVFPKVFLSLLRSNIVTNNTMFDSFSQIVDESGNEVTSDNPKSNSAEMI